MLSQQHIQVINKSVLCWLATVSKDGQPNVSPKEIFTNYEDDKIIIANIASPQSGKNIKENPKASVSFIDIFLQKGYQIKGEAQLITERDELFLPYKAVLNLMLQDKFPFNSVFEIQVKEIKDIKAPSYLFYSNTNEQEMIDNAKEAYGIDKFY